MSNENNEESNRENAQKSTGPRTDRGKSIVSQNARKHGLLSQHLIIKGESKEEFDALLSELISDLEPVGLVEFSLAERVAIALWRQRRIVRAESASVALKQLSF